MIESASPNIGQMIVTGLSAACFAASAIAAISAVARHASPRGAATPSGATAIPQPSAVPRRRPIRVGVVAGFCFALFALIWHAASRGSWMPLEDNFEALVWLGLLLALLDVYLQRRRPVAGLDAFMLPIVVLLLIGAGLFGRMRPHAYVDSAWSLVHQATAYLGAAAFAVACAVGAMYLVASARLRSKSIDRDVKFGNLERLERLIDWSVTLGFALLTIALVTGLVKILHRGGDTALGKHWMESPKVILAFTVWLIYAMTLHTPISPSIRGRRAALMSIVGFVLMIGSLVAAQFMPGGPR